MFHVQPLGGFSRLHEKSPCDNRISGVWILALTRQVVPLFLTWGWGLWRRHQSAGAISAALL